MAATVLQRIACKAVIANKNKVLVLREANTYQDGTEIGKYGLPGGRIEPGEPLLDGLLREVTEETGLTVKVGEPLFVGEWFPNIRGVQNQIVAIFFVCQTDQTEVILSEEHDEFQWVDAAMAIQLPMMPPDDEVVQKYFSQAT